MEIRKLGLVLCNTEYPHAKPSSLPGGKIDHKNMVEALNHCGFEQEITDTMNKSGEEMIELFDQFVASIERKASRDTKQQIFTLFYYSGHGEADSHGNFLP